MIADVASSDEAPPQPWQQTQQQTQHDNPQAAGDDEGHANQTGTSQHFDRLTLLPAIEEVARADGAEQHAPEQSGGSQSKHMGCKG